MKNNGRGEIPAQIATIYETPGVWGLRALTAQHDVFIFEHHSCDEQHY